MYITFIHIKQSFFNIFYSKDGQSDPLKRKLLCKISRKAKKTQSHRENKCQ